MYILKNYVVLHQKTTQKRHMYQRKKRGNRDSGQEKAVTRYQKSFAYKPSQ
jgi:hypothetical protein